MSDERQLLVETSAGICTITFNRPEKKNAFTVKMYEDCVEALKKAAADPTVRVVLFTGGNGAAFTSGNDLVDFMNAPPTGEDSAVFQFLLALADFEKPLIAAVNGLAIGVGVTMLLHCDLVYVADSAKLTTPFVPLGLVPEAASSLLLPKIAGFAKANEILLLGEPIDAAFAVSAGIAARMVPTAELAAFARAKAERIASLAPAALRATKKLLRDPLRDDIRKTLYTEAVLFAERLGSPEAAEAFQSFFEKRKPDFSKFN